MNRFENVETSKIRRVQSLLKCRIPVDARVELGDVVEPEPAPLGVADAEAAVHHDVDVAGEEDAPRAHVVPRYDVPV